MKRYNIAVILSVAFAACLLVMTIGGTTYAFLSFQGEAVFVDFEIISDATGLQVSSSDWINTNGDIDIIYAPGEKFTKVITVQNQNANLTYTAVGVTMVGENGAPIAWQDFTNVATVVMAGENDTWDIDTNSMIAYYPNALDRNDSTTMLTIQMEFGDIPPDNLYPFKARLALYGIQADSSANGAKDAIQKMVSLESGL